MDVEVLLGRRQERWLKSAMFKISGGIYYCKKFKVQYQQSKMQLCSLCHYMIAIFFRNSLS